MTGSAIVLDGHLKSALAAVRSLGKQGITVVCGAERRSALACHSRYTSESFVYVSPKTNQTQFLNEIIAQAQKLQHVHREKPVVFCFSDATMLTLASAPRELFEYVTFSLPAPESVLIASDKAATYDFARRLSIPLITTYAEDIPNPVSYPVVVKNRHSIVWREGKGVSGSASFAFTEAQMQKCIRTIEFETGEHPVVQDFIQGDEYGVEMVCAHGEILAEFIHKRIRSLSPRGGAAVVKETAPVNEYTKLMQTYAHNLVHELAWHGPVMVEFKQDQSDNSVRLMEINGRFWGSLPLAVAAGVDFPLFVYGLESGALQKPLAFEARHLRTRHFLGDCKWLWGVLFARDPLRKRLYPARLYALWEFMIEPFRSQGDIFSFDDPLPSIMEYIDILRIWK